MALKPPAWLFATGIGEGRLTIKLGEVASSSLAVSGRATAQLLISGADPTQLGLFRDKLTVALGGKMPNPARPALQPLEPNRVTTKRTPSQAGMPFAAKPGLEKVPRSLDCEDHLPCLSNEQEGALRLIKWVLVLRPDPHISSRRPMADSSGDDAPLHRWGVKRAHREPAATPGGRGGGHCFPRPPDCRVMGQWDEVLTPELLALPSRCCEAGRDTASS